MSMNIPLDRHAILLECCSNTRRIFQLTMNQFSYWRNIMKVLYIIVVCFVLIGCGISPEQGTETVIAAQTKTQKAVPTNTPSATPSPNVTATYLAIRAATQTAQVFNSRIKLTAFAAPTSIAIAEAGQVLEKIRETAGDNLDQLDISNAKLVYGPRNDTLTQGPFDFIVVDNSNLTVQNFIASIEFINPYDKSKTGAWDYGILFRDRYGNNQYRLTILSDQSWSLYDADASKNIYSSYDKRITVKAGDKNSIWLIVSGSKAYLFINNEYIKTLDVSTRIIAGDVSPATGLYFGNLKDGKVTEYQNFSVWSLP